MELKDLVITPVYLIIIYLLAFLVRDRVSDKLARRYFIPGLTVKIIGAIAVGLIYQFYYQGGDTFNFFDGGSKYIWEAFKDSPIKAFQLIFANGSYESGTFQYASNMLFYRDPSSYFVVRVAGFFDLFTLHTYSATAVLFASLSFSGLWALYLAFYRFFPRLHFEFAIAVFFIPSVFFWGSGILKDTLTLGALGWATYAIVQIFFRKRNVVINTLILFCASFVLYTIKIYILLCFLPAVIFWLFFNQVKEVRSIMLRIMITPFIIGIAGFLCYYAIVKVGEENARYSLDTIGKTAEITATYIHYVSEKQGGSAYTLGDFDYSVAGMLRKFPLAVNVSLFRPYLWEVKNPVMLMSALESLGFLVLTLLVILKSGFLNVMKNLGSRPVIIFCILFSISFAFAVGFSTYNFGSLVRYKIPLIPFYLMGLFIIRHYSNKPKKIEALNNFEY